MFFLNSLVTCWLEVCFCIIRCAHSGVSRYLLSNVAVGHEQMRVWTFEIWPLRVNPLLKPVVGNKKLLIQSVDKPHVQADKKTRCKRSDHAVQSRQADRQTDPGWCENAAKNRRSNLDWAALQTEENPQLAQTLETKWDVKLHTRLALTTGDESFTLGALAEHATKDLIKSLLLLLHFFL